MLKAFQDLRLIGLAVMLLCTACSKDDDISQAPVEVPTPETFRVLLNGALVNFDSVETYRFDGLRMLPARAMMEKLGFRCSESQHDRSLICRKADQSFVLTADQSEVLVNQSEIRHLLVSPQYQDDVLFVESHFFEMIPSIGLEWDVESASLQLYDYDQLDYGLYFVDGEPNGWSFDDALGSQKLIAGEPNLFYDPDKPTLIWIHGWQNGSVELKSRTGFLFNTLGIDKYTHQIWKDKGWNVAIFYWINLADELLPNDAESKINSATNNAVGMRWKLADGNYAPTMPADTPVTELFAQAYQQFDAMQRNPEVVIAGSSFGGQVALHGTERILNNGIANLPQRVALLDMAWTLNWVENQSAYTYEISERAAAALSPHLAIEFYRSSILPYPFTPDGLIDHSMFCELVFGFAGSFNIELQHTYVTHHYLWSFEHDSPACYDEDGNIAAPGPSAATSTTQIRQMMGTEFHWQHLQGTLSPNPQDDVFERQDGPGY